MNNRKKKRSVERYSYTFEDDYDTTLKTEFDYDCPIIKEILKKPYE